MTIPRLFVDGGLAPGARISLEPARVSYLLTVLRRRAGDPVLLFNCADGEWMARLAVARRREVVLEVGERTRAPAAEAGTTLALAPIRRSRLDWVVEKAVELGVGRIEPVLTERGVVKLDNPGRLRAIAVEAAEQCGRLSVPVIEPPVLLHVWLDRLGTGACVLLADEARDGVPLHAAPEAAALLIGPEGGFSPAERSMLRDDPAVVPIRLGPLILRAETAALVALAGIALRRDAAPRPPPAGQCHPSGGSVIPGKPERP